MRYSVMYNSVRSIFLYSPIFCAIWFGNVTAATAQSGQADNASIQEIAKQLESGGAQVLYKNGLPIRVSFPSRDATNATIQDVVKLKKLISLSLTGSKITDASLIPLKDLDVIQLQLADTNIGDLGMAYLVPITGLSVVNIDNTRVNDRGLQYLAEHKRLSDIRLCGTHIRNDGLRHLSSLKSLWRLAIGGRTMTNQALTHLRGLPRLSSLELYGTGFSDIGLKQLESFPHLKYLTLVGTKTTSTGIDSLKRAKPELEVHIRNQPTPRSQKSSNTSHKKTNRSQDRPLATNSESFQEIVKKLSSLGAEFKTEGNRVIHGTLSNVSIGDREMAWLSQLTTLESLNLSKTQVNDDLLQELATLKRLKSLRLYQTEVTWLGITELEKSLPRLKVHALAPSETESGSGGWIVWVMIPGMLAVFVSMGVYFVKFSSVFRAVHSSQTAFESKIKSGEEYSRSRATAIDESRAQMKGLSFSFLVLFQTAGLFFALVGVAFAIQSVVDVVYANSTKSWPKTEGEIVVSRYRTRSSTDKEGRSSTSYIPIVLYRYEVDGKQYVGDRVATSRIGSDAARKVPETYAVGTRTQVSYDPNDHEHAVLEAGVGRSNYIAIGVSSFVSIFGATAFFVCRMKRRKQILE